jgi:2-keto-4-pentenoate hydratase/2-oxohepta-3-ene-1,7-dioic acid hydratase in catechol pathway
MTQSDPVAPHRLATAEIGGRPFVVVAVGDALYRLDAVLGDVAVPDHVHELLSEWPAWETRLDVALAQVLDAPTVAIDRWLPPVRPPKLVCVGVNYRDHLAEMGTPDAPPLPYTFLKPTSTGLVASGAAVAMPIGATMLDWEAELAVVIGRPLRAGRGPSVLDAVAGYTVYNDLSARDWLASKAPGVGVDWVLMKGHDGFSPVGPYLTPRRFVTDPQSLAIRCWVNGDLKQDSSTSQMIFGVQEILEHISAVMTLEPGVVIATGTPAGVGFGARPQQFLRPGDGVAVEIEGLGRLETIIVDQHEGVAA